MTTYTWAAGNSGNWADASNWSPSGYPDTPGDVAIVNAAGTYTIDVANGETDALSALTLDAAGATLSVAGTLAFTGANILALTAGSLVMGSTGSIAGTPDMTIGASGTFDVTAASQTVGSLSGSGLVLLGNKTLTTGGDDVSTTFSGTVQGGSVDSGAFVQNGSGTLTLDNATMTNNELIVGTGNLAVGSGTSQVFYLAVGEGTNGGAPYSGTVTISGGTLNIGGASATLQSALQVGDFGGTGLVMQTGGAVNVTGSFNVGNQGGNGTYDLSGGTLTLLGGSYDIGRNAGSHAAGSGTLNISGGELDIATGALVLGNWYPNAGTVESSGKIVQTAGTVWVEGASQIFLAALGNGEYDLGGGTLKVGGNGLRSQFNGNGAGVLHMGGGTLQVTGSDLTTDANIVLDSATTSTLTLGALNATLTGALTGAGTLIVSGAGTASFLALNATGALQLQGATLDMSGSDSIGTLSGTGTVNIAGGSVLSIAGTVGAGAAIIFAGEGAALKLADPADFNGALSGFDSSDTIDLAGLAYDAGGSATLNRSTDILTVMEDGYSYRLQLTGDYTGDYFHLVDDRHGGTTITMDGTPPSGDQSSDSEITQDGTPCYCRGTRILTDRGEIAVEGLRIGDRLITAAGIARPIRWIGKRSYAGHFAAGNRDVLPIVIRQGALGDNVPRRDLWVSPLHAMYLDGLLIPAWALVNGDTIAQAARVDRVEYFHLELETHDVIVAEGAQAESFLDDDSRGMFLNAASYRRAYPKTARKPPRYCAPRIEEGELLQAIRDRLSARTEKASRGA